MDKRAHAAVAAAIRAGILVRPKQCPECEREVPVQAHHESYDPERWLEVEWLCSRCHIRAHASRPHLNSPGRPRLERALRRCTRKLLLDKELASLIERAAPAEERPHDWARSILRRAADRAIRRADRG